VEGRDDRDAVLLVDPAQELHHGVGQRGVDARHRLVGQDHRRLLEQRPRDGHALLLAARERVYPATGETVEANAYEDGVGLRDLRGLEPAHQRPPAGGVREPAEERVLEHGEPAQEVELLKHEAPMRARTRRSASGEAPVTASSPIRTSPAVGTTSPFRQRSRVDFPAPLGPMRATNSPGPMSRSTPSSARGPPG